jgi:hypothetical protein
MRSSRAASHGARRTRWPCGASWASASTLRQGFGRGTPRGLPGPPLEAPALEIALAMFWERLWVPATALLAHLRLLRPVARSQSALAIA